MTLQFSTKPRLLEEDNGDILACDRRIDMEFTEQDRGSRIPPTPQGGLTSNNLEGAQPPTYFPGHPSGSTHTQKIESSMPQSDLCSPADCRSPATVASAASQLKAETSCGGSNTDYIIKNDIPSEGEHRRRRPLGLAEPGSPQPTAKVAANLLLNKKSVIVSCVVSSPSPSSRLAIAATPPKMGGEPPLSALTIGPHDDTDLNDISATTNPSTTGRAKGYINAISDTVNCSSTTNEPAARCLGSDHHSRPPSPKTAGCTSERPAAGQDNITPCNTTAAMTKCVTGDHSKPSKTRLSQECVLPTTGWRLPPGGGLRGGAPLPGETSAISGTSGWGPPPAASVHASGTGAWGSAPPPNNGTGAWGSSAANGIGGPGAGNDDPTSGNGPNPKLLNPAVSSVGGLATSASSSQPAASSAAPPSAVGGTTSWAAAAGKGLPPQPEPSANGATKPIEVLNSLREALYSPDGWGGQNVKQDTSWDVGGSVPEPAVPPMAVKQDAMQWQSTSSGRNDGTDLWKSNLSGVPPPVKPQPTTPWGNHTPAHPADYKTWGEPEDDAGPPPGGDRRGGGGGGGVGGGPGDGGPNNWNDDNSGVGGNAGPGGAGNQPWDTDSGKNKEENWSNPTSNHQWGPGAPGSGGNMQMDQRMDAGANSGGNSGWGAPPPVKPSGPGGAGSWGGGPPRGSGADQWHHDSPSAPRRMDDGGTSIWGKNGGVQGVAPGGGWKDMPVPNLGPRAPPGPPTRMPPGPGNMKPGDPSPWGNQPLPGRGWGDDSLASANPWDGGDKTRNDMGPGLPTGGAGAGNPVDFWHKKPLRTSPSWEDGGANGMAGAGGSADARGWGGGSRAPPFTKESIMMSKQFRVLCEMGFRKEEAETALRNTSMQLEDAIDMLNNMNRGNQMPNRGGMPPTADPSGFIGGGASGPRGGDPSGYDMRYQNPGSGMPYNPVGDIPPTNPSLPNNTSRGSMNPALVQQMPMMPGGPPRPPQSGTPSTSQLRLLVQQIQMAVQAGHLNAQILNQPLAPQTLLLLNQLLQQIKLLQQCKNQQQQCMTSGNRNSQSNQAALLHLSVQITKHNQNITNLQNQITVQQAQYLKSQQPATAPPGALPPPPDTEQLNLNLGNLQLGGGGGGGAQDQQQQQQTGSKLNKWIKNDNPDSDFSRAPGSSKSSTSQPSPNVLLEGGSTWSNGNNGVGGGSGWPDSNDKSGNNNSADDSDNFGIPEFVPGKAWKGSSLKDPSEDPTLTPGSVAANPLLHTQPQSADNKASSTGVISSSQASINNSSVENSLGLTSTTWSFGNNAVSKDNMSNGGGWGASVPLSSSTSNLTTMGQDLWGMPPRSAKQPSVSGWPGSVMSNGWSNGTNMPGGTGGNSSWLLLKNLTAQIDGSTLRTLCMQHGPLQNFQLFLTHGIALAKYSNGSEAKKAQNALNNCVLGNTTILALVTDEHEVENIVRSLSQGGGQRAAAPSTSNPSFPNYSAAQQIAKSSSADSWSNLWSTGGGGVSSGSVWGAPDDQHNRTTPLNSFIPTDLLSETM